jgi:hypothetical protein
MRKAVVAGQFYPADKTELEKEVRKFLSKSKKQKIKACVVPHAGYTFSGKLAGDIIGKIDEKKTFILLGVNHSGLGNKLSMSKENFETSFGEVKNNVDLGGKILKQLEKVIDADINEEVHRYEHSIEVQLPFLQLSQKSFDIVPIILTRLSYEDCIKVASMLAGFVNDDICLLVSSDFTHYGWSFRFVPFEDNVRENIYKLDKEIIQEILNLNAKKVYVKASESTVCGLYGLTVLTLIAKLKKWEGKLIDYYTSGDITKDWYNVVGYAGIIFS